MTPIITTYKFQVENKLPVRAAADLSHWQAEMANNAHWIAFSIAFAWHGKATS
jgi:hypothetical protein